MITVRPADERGGTRRDWLDSRHTFSFGDYVDPRHQGFRALRVINDDRVGPEQGFPRHPHRDMEILTWVLEGALEHRDSLGNGSVIRPGDAQRMSAGTGIAHSEFNPAPTEPVRFLQVWILPATHGVPPSWEQRHFPPATRRAALRLIAAGDGRDGAITIDQDVDVFATLLAPGDAVTHALAQGRHAWVQVARGAVRLGDRALAEGDGAAVSDERVLTLTATAPAELLLFDLA
ncbi:MAG TPA: pirin family protein [Candidatus Binatia bacterium]|nr:pirin family protein [Candidatus Binatia bacterium]